MGERIYIIVGIFLFVIGVRNIVLTRLSNDLAEKSIYYNMIRQETELIQNQNQELQDEIDYYESYTMIASEAASLGFSPENEYYLIK